MMSAHICSKGKGYWCCEVNIEKLFESEKAAKEWMDKFRKFYED